MCYSKHAAKPLIRVVALYTTLRITMFMNWGYTSLRGRVRKETALSCLAEIRRLSAQHRYLASYTTHDSRCNGWSRHQPTSRIYATVHRALEHLLVLFMLSPNHSQSDPPFLPSSFAGTLIINLPWQSGCSVHTTRTCTAGNSRGCQSREQFAPHSQYNVLLLRLILLILYLPRYVV